MVHPRDSTKVINSRMKSRHHFPHSSSFWKHTRSQIH
ncbi:hypothetical protein KAR91_14520 [Candidatus Pacearchaeota archaeon]|nr:hypothetical protein [Candidatus Pacearchaeota archaeon]